MTGALLCSLGEVREELVEEEEGEEEGTLEDSLSPLFMARTECPTLVSKLLGFGNEFSERRPKRNDKLGSVIQYSNVKPQCASRDTIIKSVQTTDASE